MNLEIPHPPVPGEEEPDSPTMKVELEHGSLTSTIPTMPKQQYLSLDKVEYIVVDEADLMLDISLIDYDVIINYSLITGTY